MRIAQRHGAIGVILFTDPADFAGGPGSRVYPGDWWMPPTGTQRGTLFIGEGDPQTPGYPSIGWFCSDLYSFYTIASLQYL